MRAYTVSLGKVVGRFQAWPGHHYDHEEWTEPVTYATDDREEVDRTVLDLLAKHPEYTRARVKPVWVNAPD